MVARKSGGGLPRAVHPFRAADAQGILRRGFGGDGAQRIACGHTVHGGAADGRATIVRQAGREAATTEGQFPRHVVARIRRPARCARGQGDGGAGLGHEPGRVPRNRTRQSAASWRPLADQLRARPCRASADGPHLAGGGVSHHHGSTADSRRRRAQVPVCLGAAGVGLAGDACATSSGRHNHARLRHRADGGRRAGRAGSGSVPGGQCSKLRN